MKRSLLTLILAFGLAATALVAIPALAQERNETNGDDNKTHDRPDRRERHQRDYEEARGEWRQAKEDARAERNETRAGLHNATVEHRLCLQEARAGANNTSGNGTSREAFRACNETFREDLRGINTDARERYLAAKERARQQYLDRLESAREAYKEGRGGETDRKSDNACAANMTCSARMVAHWEAKLERAEGLKADLEAKLADAEAELANASGGNDTSRDELRLQDRILVIKIHILQVDRAILRIEAKIDAWQETPAAPDDSGPGGNTTGNETS